MDPVYQQFVSNLYNFSVELHQYAPSSDTEKFIEVFEQLNMGKVILRYLNIVREHEPQIKNKDESIFNNQFNILPGIDLSAIWQKLDQPKKARVWTYLQILYVLCESMMTQAKKIEQTGVSFEQSNDDELLNRLILNAKQAKNEDQDQDKGKQEITFNPYIGVGGSDENYSVEQMFGGPDTLPAEEESGPNVGLGLGNMMGLDKMLDLGELSKQFKDIDPDELGIATENIKKMMGENVDEKTSNTMSDMLNNITSELKNGDLSEGNPFENLVKIAENVAKKMKPQLESGELDLSGFMGTTANLANNCQDSGEPMGSPNMMDMFNNMMNMMQGAQSAPQQSDANTTPFPAVNEELYRRLSATMQESREEQCVTPIFGPTDKTNVTDKILDKSTLSPVPKQKTRKKKKRN